MDESMNDEAFNNEIIETDLNDLCRICGSTSDSPLIAIYEENGLSEELASKIMQYLPIKLSEEDVLPVKACVTCTNSVLTWHLLYECCVDADRRFKSMLSEEELIERPQSAVEQDEPMFGEDDEGNEQAVELHREMDDNLMLKTQFGPEDEQYLDDESNLQSDENRTEIDEQNRVNVSDECDHLTIVCMSCSTKLLNDKDEIFTHIAASDIYCDIRCLNCYEHMSKKSNTYKCEICELHFASKSELMVHRSEHDKFTCNICDKQVKNYASLVTHKKLHDPNFTFFHCPICDWHANRKYNLQLHIKSHSQDYFCKICCNSFNSLQLLENHKANHMKVDLMNYENCQARVSCHECDELFDSNYKVFFHAMEKHNVESEKLRCEECGRIFETIAMLRIHEKTHNKKIFPCEICHKTFSKMKSYEEHKNAHSDSRPFECDICSKRFKYSSNLSQHKAIHRGLKNFTCQYCDRKFIRSNALQMHLRSHRNERRFICDICSAAFIQQSSLIKHKRSVHRKCDICKQIVGDRKQLKTHVWKECSELNTDEAVESILEINN